MKMPRFNWPIYRFALTLGLTSIIEKHFTIGAKQLLAPVLYWRFPEFSECLSAIDAVDAKSLKILDIGSPKLLSLFLALKRNHTVFATDLQDHEIFNRYKQHFEDWQALRGSPGEYIVEFQDARSLQYEDDTFDVVFSLEVLGHIPAEGDMSAMQEIERVLKKGGVAVIAVPYANKAEDIFVKNDVYDRQYEGEPVFYLRQFDEQSLQDRLVMTSNMVLEKKIILGERLPFDTWWDRVPTGIKVPFMSLEAFLSRMNLKAMDRDDLQRDIHSKNDRCMNITLVFKKQ